MIVRGSIITVGSFFDESSCLNITDGFYRGTCAFLIEFGIIEAY